MLSRVTTFAIDGVESRRVWVEADIRLGLPAFTIVGLADKAVREARERVRAAIVNSGHEFPQKRITVNLAPAYLRKIGPGFDLPLAVAILVASDQLEADSVEDTRGHGRAVAERRAAGDPRRARDRRGSAPAPAVAPPAATRPRARGRAGAGSHGARRRVAARGRRRAGGPRRATTATGAARGGGERPDARPRRRPRPERADPGARGGSRRRPQRLHARPARHGEDDARAAPAVDPAAADGGRGGRRHSHPFGRGAARRRRARRPAPVPRAPPHDLGVRPGRRRLAPAARRGDARAPRRPVPRRAVGVRALEPRGPAPAARGRPRHDRASAAGGHVPDALHARRRLQPVPMRDGGGGMPLHGGRPRAPPAPALRPAARPHRRPRPGVAPDRGRAARRVGAAVVGESARE